MKRKLLRKIGLGISALALSCTMVLTGILPNFTRSQSIVEAETPAETAEITNVTGLVENDLRDYLDASVTQKLSDTISPDREISVMLALDAKTILDGYNELGETSMTVADFSVSREGKAIASKIEKESKTLKTVLNRSGLKYETGFSYNTLFGGFEIVIKAGDFEQLQKAVGKSANIFVSEEYAPCETTVVENDVNVHDTGIFDSTDSEYSGSGTVVAILDTGLDYTHSAFDPSRFEGEEVFTRNSIANLMDDMRAKGTPFTAASMTQGLTASDVYINKKVPYAYDYADGDPDVFPIESDHGTHVAGIMVGRDADNNPNGIRGVAPNAQLVFMKVFSDSRSGAKNSWIIAGLEDCVKLGVDVINMSLGSSSSFSREVDEIQRQAVYDSIKACGINLVAAASNDGSAAQGSTQNGNQGLTSNPDTGTVGSPSSYEASMSVANISGIKTPYLLYNDTLIYFNESRNNAGKARNFVNEILTGIETTKDFEYIYIPGVGRSSEYTTDVRGKIVLVKRGQTSFEEKARVAQEKGAAGLIVYNNVSGDIIMTIGYADFPVISVSRDDGELLAGVAGGRGYITISKNQQAGPFMESSSSWGPTPDLSIKPEITAHGGEIYSSIPGGRYDRFTGTSMASPNQAGLTALVRQYVKDTFPELANDRVAITGLVNQLMMSTTDIALNKSGLPFAVRRQGAGLANLTKSTSTPAYLRTYVREHYDERYTNSGLERKDPSLINDKTKIEFGDDPDKTGVYTFDFEIVNISDRISQRTGAPASSLSYDVSAVVMSEGVSNMPTYKGLYTVDEMGHLLEGATTTVLNVENGTRSGNTVTVAAGETAIVTVQIVLSESDKAYIDANFDNGMYVEGFIQLKAKSDKAVDLSVAYLGFFGDWTQAPLMDLDIFETDADAKNDAIDDEQKVMSAFNVSTTPVGGLYDDYIAYLGSFPYLQDPSSRTKVTADRDRIALTNQDGKYGGINSISAIWFGLLRGAKTMELSIIDEATGEVVWTAEDYNMYKSYAYGGSQHVSSGFKIDFSVREHDLKNNTKYIVRAIGYIDYADGGIDTNVRNVFEFPFYTDFEAPIATGVSYSYEYDRTSETNKLYADVSIYDNHYVLGYIAGVIGSNADYDPNDEDSYRFSTDTFSQYITPVSGQRNSTTVIRIDLTDHIEEIRNSHDGRSFMIQTMDCALNSATFEFQIPDEVAQISFPEMKPDEDGNVAGIVINPNELYRLKPVTVPAQDQAWYETLRYEVVDEQIKEGVEATNNQVVTVMYGQLLGIHPGTATVLVRNNSYDENNPEAYNGPVAELKVTVRGPGDDGYKEYSIRSADSFTLKGYYTNKVYYMSSSEDRDLGVDKAYNTNGERRFVTLPSTSRYNLSMFPSESIQVLPEIKGYYGDDQYRVVYQSYDPNVVSVDQEGTITALNVYASGEPRDTVNSTTVNISLEMWNEAKQNWESANYAVTISIEVKEQYKTNNGAYLMNYYGLGGTVVIPTRLRLTTIYQFAFSNSEYVPKDLSAGDVIDKEDPYTMKQWFIGDDTIERIIVPEGVELIEAYAFANLTKLKEVILPSTLNKIQTGAFYNCTSLESVKFGSYPDGKYVDGEYVPGEFVACENNLQFINERVFYNCRRLGSFNFGTEKHGVIALGTGAFENAGLTSIRLPRDTQSLSANAFRGNEYLSSVTINADKIKIGANTFAGCQRLSSIKINASVIPEGAFDGCVNLTDVTIGEEVSVIGQYAFRNTNVSRFTVDPNNAVFEPINGGEYLMEKGTGRLALVASSVMVFSPAAASDIKTIGTGAFSTSNGIVSIRLPNVTVVEDYAFVNCSNLTSVSLGELTAIGEGAFMGTQISKLPDLAENAEVGAYAFAQLGSARFTSVVIPNGVTVGDYAFYYNKLTQVTIGANSKVGNYAFYGNYTLGSVQIGDNVEIGEYAFAAMTSTEYVSLFEDHMLNMREQGFTWDGLYAAYFLSGDSYSFGESSVSTLIIPYISSISKLTIGDNAKIGDYAFRGAGSGSYANFFMFGNTQNSYFVYSGAELQEVALGEGAEIGAYAFYGCRYLTNISNLSKATAIGDYAFSGVTTEYMIRYINTEPLAIRTRSIAPALEEVDLSSATTLGAGAFAYNEALTSITLGNIENGILADEVFFGCTSLAQVDVSGISVIGNRAFSGSALTSITLKEGVEIGDEAFASNLELANVTGLESAVSIGRYAFAYDQYVTSADLSAAKKIGDFAFSFSGVTEVVLSDDLTVLGENPFAGCFIPEFTNKSGETTYNIGSRVRVIDGVLYRNNTNGMELITYPIEKQEAAYNIVAGTNRIGAQAFLGSSIVGVTVNREMKSIGDKAFYGCEKLAVVNFTGSEAPRLEEQYNYDYDNGLDFELGLNITMRDSVGITTIPLTSGEFTYAGTGLVPFYMWSYDQTSVLYGANFIAGINTYNSETGKRILDSYTLIMVRPSNGTGYETFTYKAYFDAIWIGRAAISDEALAVMELIEGLPTGTALKAENYDEVYRIYALYEALNADDQAYLNSEMLGSTSYYQTLITAKNIVDVLHKDDSPIGPGPDIDIPSEESNLIWLWIVIGIVGGCAVIATIGLIVLNKKKSAKAENETENGNSEKSEEEKSE